jgi:hypothetical protein
MLHLQPRGNADAGAFSVRNRVHNLATTVRAISTSKKFRVGSLTCRAIDEDASAFQLNLRAPASRLSEKTGMCPLPDRQNNEIRFERKLRARFRDN